MIGNWYALINTPNNTLKVQFKVAHKATYTLDAVVEPLPIPLIFSRVESEGNKINGYGKVFWNEDEEFYVKLQFEESSFTGEMYIPSLGIFPLDGEKGTGPYMAEALIEEVKPYRK